MMSMNLVRTRWRLLALFGLFSLAGCHVPDHVVVHVSRQQIQDQVDTRFPMEKRELICKAKFTDPVVRLMPDTNGVGVDIKARLEFARDAAIDGRGSFEGTLDYDPSLGQLYVRKIRLVDTHLESVPASIAPLVRGIGGMKTVDGLFREICRAVPPHLADMKIGQLPDDWKGRTAKSVIRTVRVNGDGLDIEIGVPR